MPTCPEAIRILDDRWGGITRSCELDDLHAGDHEIAMDACIPPAKLKWPNPGVDCEHCQRCGRPYSQWWDAPRDLWAQLVDPDGAGLRCIPCFDELASAAGITLRWVPMVDGS